MLSRKTKEQWLDEGTAYFQAYRTVEALAAYEQALRLDPDDVTLYLHQGNALYRLNHFQEAVVAYEQALQLHPNDAIAHNGRGKLPRQRHCSP